MINIESIFRSDSSVVTGGVGNDTIGEYVILNAGNGVEGEKIKRNWEVLLLIIVTDAQNAMTLYVKEYSTVNKKILVEASITHNLFVTIRERINVRYHNRSNQRIDNT